MTGGNSKYLIRQGFRNVWVNRIMSIASIAVLLASLLIMGAGLMVYHNINALLNHIEGQNVIMVYIKENADDLETSKVGVEIKNLKNIDSCEFIPKEQAFKDQVKKLGTDSAIFEGLSESPLPNAYKVTVKDLNLFADTVNKIKAISNVDNIRENSSLATKLASLQNAISVISVVLVSILFLVALFIISNTIRITMYTRRLEIQIMKGVGATNWFIRWPFIIEGILLGTIAGVIGTLALWGVYAGAGKVFADTLTLFNFKLVSFGAYWGEILGLFLCLGVAAGAFGSAISMNKYLKEQESIVDDE